MLGGAESSGGRSAEGRTRERTPTSSGRARGAQWHSDMTAHPLGKTHQDSQMCGGAGALRKKGCPARGVRLLGKRGVPWSSDGCEGAGVEWVSEHDCPQCSRVGFEPHGVRLPFGAPLEPTKGSWGSAGNRGARGPRKGTSGKNRGAGQSRTRHGMRGSPNPAPPCPHTFRRTCPRFDARRASCPSPPSCS